MILTSGRKEASREWKERSNTIYCLILLGYQVCFRWQSCPLALPQCHPQLHSLIALLLLWATPQLPARLPQLWISAQVLCPTEQTSPLSVALAFFAGRFLVLVLKLVVIATPWSMYQGQHLLSSAPPQMSLLSLCSHHLSFVWLPFPLSPCHWQLWVLTLHMVRSHPSYLTSSRRS